MFLPAEGRGKNPHDLEQSIWKMFNGTPFGVCAARHHPAPRYGGATAVRLKQVRPFFASGVAAMGFLVAFVTYGEGTLLFCGGTLS